MILSDMDYKYLEDSNLDRAHRGFVTYKNYLLGLSYLLDLMYPDYSTIATRLKSVQPRPNVDIQKICNLLLNSWNSELLLNFPDLLQDDYLKFSNHWAPVQSYYSIYLAMRALIVAKNINAKGDHATTLQVIVSNLIQNEKLLPLPWGVLLGSQGFKNLPKNITLHQISSLENPYHFRTDMGRLWDSLYLFLRTTCKRIIEERCQDWKNRHPTKRGPRKKLPAGQREKLSQNLHPVSVFDCFYRLRIRSSYRDVDIFILGSSTPETKYYFNALCNITDKTLFVIENYLYRYLGKRKMEQIISYHQKADTLGIAECLKFGASKRRQYYG